jgi:hypothetical protein
VRLKGEVSVLQNQRGLSKILMWSCERLVVIISTKIGSKSCKNNVKTPI